MVESKPQFKEVNISLKEAVQQIIEFIQDNKDLPEFPRRWLDLIVACREANEQRNDLEPDIYSDLSREDIEELFGPYFGSRKELLEAFGLWTVADEQLSQQLEAPSVE